VSRVVLPRELGLDEIKAVAAACPDGLDLEAFVHGALCYAVSGRCYWSSYMGGKSGLRGRCVQPCRRTYEHQGHKARFFSCMDLSLDVLAKTLAAVPKVRALKIEGRKKGPHYVFYTVRAYRTLLDHPTDPEAKKMALDLLDQALGRPTTHYGFLPQRPRPAVEPGTQTGSGRLVGKVLATPKDGLYVSTRERLLQGDLLRVGYEDEPWHQTLKVRRGVPKQGRLDFRPEGSDPRSRPRSGTPVFLVDRREPELMARIAGLDQESRAFPGREVEASDFAPAMPHPASRRRPAKAQRSQDLDLYRRPPHGKVRGETGLWLGPDSPDLPQSLLARAWFSLPPVIWPDEEEATAGLVRVMLGRGATRFLLNAPWQLCLFDGAGDRAGRKGGDGDLLLYAGPFCNLANGLALGALAAAGFHGAVVSPELSREDYLALPGQSPLPLGIVVHGPWPLAISRTMAEEVKAEEGLRSPKGETCWTRRIGQNHWIFPDWELDLDQERAGLERAGYSLFIRLHEPWPKSVDRRERTSRFNLDLRLL
jgi:putative protease